MSPAPIGKNDARFRSPVHGPAQTLKTQAQPMVEEQRAAAKLTNVSERDLDLFLQARAKKSAQSQNKGIFASIAALFEKPKATTTGAAVARDLKSTLADIGQIYADGFVTEHEVGALLAAGGRLRAVQQLGDNDVLMMLPRDVRERLQTQLFEPLTMIEAAATRRGKRVWSALVARDRDAVMSRLNAPVEHRTLDVDVLVRSGLSATSLARYVPGDLICVPRSDGSFSRGVVTANFGDRVDVEMLDAHGNLEKKTLTAEQVERANPLKVGDKVTFDGKTIWATGSDEHGLYGFVDDERAVRTRVDARELDRIAAQTFGARMNQTMLGNALSSVRGYFDAPRDTQRALEGLLSLKGDPVFGRQADALRALLKDPRFVASTPQQQTQQLTALVRDRAHLHSVMPNFGSERANHANVTMGSTTWGNADVFQCAGAKPRAIKTQVTLTVADATKTFDIVMPESMTHADRIKTYDELTTALQKLPPEVVASLRSIVINPEKNPGDAFFAKRFNDPAFTSAMTAHADTRQITVYPGTSVATALQSFAHECGHLVSIDAFGSIDGTTPRWSAWQHAINSDPLAVSQYATKATHEDFAETFSLYTSTKGTARHDAYRAMMPHRFAVLDEIAREAAR